MSDRTATTNLIEHAAECAAKLALIAMKHGATEDQAIQIGKDLVIAWIAEGLTTSAACMNARAAVRGQHAAGEQP